MAANAFAAYAIYPQNVALNEVLRTLRQKGIDKESICMMLSPTHPIATTVRESSGNSFEQVTNARTAGLIGWLSELGAVVIPSFGFFIRSRQFFHSLVLERDSMTRCGERGTLAALGFREEEAEHLEDQVRKVGGLLYVSCPETAQTRLALELLRATGAEQAGLVQNEATVETAA